MKIKHLIITLCGLFCCACGRGEEPAPSSSPDGCRVQVRLVPGKGSVSTLSRSLTPQQEAAVQDVNLYAFHTLTGDSRHLYLEGSSAAPLTLLPGAWEFYAVANTGRDMGEQSRESLEALTLETPNEEAWTGSGGIPMSARKRVEITGDASVTLELERLAARLQVNVGVAPAMSGRIAVGSVQLLSVPAEAGCFGQGAPQRYADYPAEEASSLDLPRIYYVAENLAGTVPEITRPQERSAEAAPEHATCIRITGTCDGRTVHYYVFPGENTTSDFNLHRNHDYILNITLHGADPEDARVATYDMTFTPSEGETNAGQTFRTRLRFTASGNGDNTFDLAWRFVSGGDSGAEVSISGGLPDPPGVFYYGLGGDRIDEIFDIDITSQQEGTVEIEVYATDRYGFTVGKEFSTTFVKAGPTVTFNLEGDTLYGYEFGILDLHISQPGYTGTYKATVEGSARVYYGSETSVTEFTLPGDGDYVSGVRPARLGPNPLRITVTDEEGRSEQIKSVVVGRAADVRVSAGYSGGGLDPLMILVNSSCPVGEDLEVTVEAYLSKLTMGGTTTSPQQELITITIPEGETQAGKTLRPGATYMGYVVNGRISVRRLPVTISKDKLYRYEISNQ